MPPKTKFALFAAALVVLAAAARISLAVPGSPVPQSLQTLAVLAVGVVLGPRPGALAVAVYIALGALGLPVLADGAFGVRHLLGPTGGYLLGFVVAAGVAGFLVRRAELQAPLRIVLALLVAHAAILLLGWLRLSTLVGPRAAWTQGVVPFVWGAVLKSVLVVPLALFVVRAPAQEPAAS